jgi:cell division protease FtsH
MPLFFLQVALIYVVLIAVVLQRLPISFSQHSAGQLRNRKNSNSGGAKVSESTDIVTFADVAGVDEAKEELEEIVVCVLCSMLLVYAVIH